CATWQGGRRDRLSQAADISASAQSRGTQNDPRNRRGRSLKDRRCGDRPDRRRQTMMHRLLSNQTHKSRKQLGIKHLTAVGFHHLQCLLAAESWPVRTIACQGIEDVSDTRDARGQRNLIASEPVRVTRAIPSLVMVSNNRDNIPWKLDIA